MKKILFLFLLNFNLTSCYELKIYERYDCTSVVQKNSYRIEVLPNSYEIYNYEKNAYVTEGPFSIEFSKLINANMPTSADVIYNNKHYKVSKFIKPEYQPRTNYSSYLLANQNGQPLTLENNLPIEKSTISIDLFTQDNNKVSKMSWNCKGRKKFSRFVTPFS